MGGGRESQHFRDECNYVWSLLVLSNPLHSKSLQIEKGGASETLQDCLKQMDKTDRVTRSQTSENVRVPKKDKTNGFTYYGAKLWNRLPEEYKSLKQGSYKRVIKKWIIDNIPLA